MIQLSGSSRPFSNNPGTGILDPFDSFPRTRLPRARVELLVQHCRYLACEKTVHFGIMETDNEQFCQISLFNITHSICKQSLTPSWSPGFPLLLQTQRFSTSRFRPHL
jgi:hypothetical protein